MAGNTKKQARNKTTTWKQCEHVVSVEGKLKKICAKGQNLHLLLITYVYPFIKIT